MSATDEADAAPDGAALDVEALVDDVIAEVAPSGAPHTSDRIRLESVGLADGGEGEAAVLVELYVKREKPRLAMNAVARTVLALADALEAPRPVTLVVHCDVPSTLRVTLSAEDVAVIEAAADAAARFRVFDRVERVV